MLALVTVLLLVSSALAQPYYPEIIWDRSGETDSSAYGYKILPLGDQNGDGFADWAVLAQGNGGGWHGTQRPYLEFFRGSTTPPAEPFFVFQQDSPTYYQSWSAGVIGDINGDGHKDWMTAYWPQDIPPYRIHAIFYGGIEPSNTPDFEWTMSVVTGFKWLDGFNFNGDGFDDLFWINNELREVRIYYGGSSLDTIPDWTLHQPPPGQIQSNPLAIGDFNGDGASDFMCFNNGNLAIFLGGAVPDTVPSYSWTNQFYPEAGVDSLNADNAAEWGGSYVHFGRPVLSPVPDYVLNSNSASFAVDGGDFNGDGFHDLILYTWSTQSNPFGALDLHLGYSWLNPNPVFEIHGDTPPFNLRGIYTAAGLGDVNGDGAGDIAVGAWHDWFAWRGRCVIIAGDTSIVVSTDDDRPELPLDIFLKAFPNPFNSEMTIKLTLPWSQELGELAIYNILGQQVRYEPLPPFVTEFTYRFNAHELTSGIYFLHILSGSIQKTQKLVLIR